MPTTPCEHCPPLRRAEGGINLGGRVEVTPGCPCSELLKIVEDEENNLIDQECELVNLGFATAFRHLRICAGAPRTLRPFIGTVDVTNYPPSEITYQAAFSVWPGIIDGCSADTVEPALASCYNEDGVMIFADDFAGPTVPGTFYYVRLQVNLYRSTDFVDPPVFNIDFDFSQPL